MATRALSEQIEFLMTVFGIGHQDLGRVVQTSPRTVVRWLADDHYPQHETRDKLVQLDALANRLLDTFETPDGSILWLRSPAGYFGGMRPLDALLSGRIDLVNAALEALDSGIFV